uniref:Uncharacterized protein n=1 Tax=Mycena chlorophos TaxID=658473 RepID=A0ABQ0LDW4_MYCCL|nr:predicted protein [Mycena chlorophos]
MKFSVLATTLGIATFVSAQGTRIGSPAAGANVKLGAPVTIQIIRNNGLQASTEVGMALCFLSCPTSAGAVCPPPTSELGDCPFVGMFQPTTLLPKNAGEYENITVTAPGSDESFPAGRAQLAEVRLHLIGGGPEPILEINNITINMVN